MLSSIVKNKVKRKVEESQRVEVETEALTTQARQLDESASSGSDVDE